MNDNLLRLLLCSAIALCLGALSTARADDTTQAGEHRHALLAADYSTGRIALIDEAGETIWERRIRAIHDLHHLPNGNILYQVSFTHLIEVNPETDQTVWEYDAAMTNRTGEERVEVHAFQRLADGNTLIATGNGHSVIEVTPEYEVVWHLAQHDLEGITLAWVTTLQILPNGNIVIGNCHAGPDNPQVIEVARDKEVVWSFRDFDRFGDALSNSQVVGEAARPYHR